MIALCIIASLAIGVLIGWHARYRYFNHQYRKNPGFFRHMIDYRVKVHDGMSKDEAYRQVFHGPEQDMEALGKAAYEGRLKRLDELGYLQRGEFGTFVESWESIDEEAKSIYRAEASAVLLALHDSEKGNKPHEL